ncbi:MAG: phosphatase PAP2 family protein [Limisphaerales bacterium]
MRHYRFIDYATQGYVAVVGLLILFLHGGQVPGWGWLLAAHGTCLLLVHGLIHWATARPGNRVLDFLRHFYPVLLYTGFYRETGMLNQMTISGYLDAVFIRWDQMVFGFQPSLEFMRALPWVWVSELFYAAYFSYYVMIAGVGLALFLRNRAHFHHYLAVVSFVFYGCYLIYIFLPVIGPRILYSDLVPYTPPPEAPPAELWVWPEAVQQGPFYRIMAVIYDHFESPGAAFPSSHVAIALVTVYFSFRYLRAIRWPHLVVAVMLCFSTVYCRYHYAVDVPAGALTTALLLPLANRLYWRFERRSVI